MQDQQEIRFFSPKDKKTYFMSNFYDAPFKANGVTYKTSEHYYQSQKYANGFNKSKE